MKKIRFALTASVLLIMIASGCCKWKNRKDHCNPNTSNLICYYPFNGDMLDAIKNNPTKTAFTSFGSDKKGNSGSAITFNGKNSFVSASNAFDLKERTFSLWFKANKYPNGVWPSEDLGVIMVMDNPGLKFGYVSAYVSLEDNKKILTMGMSLPGTSQIKITMGDGTSAENPKADAWHHIAMVQKDHDFCIYLDAKKVASYNISFLTSVEGGLDLKLGTARNNNSRYFDGSLDEFRFYNRALSECEVNYLYNHY